MRFQVPNHTTNGDSNKSQVTIVIPTYMRPQKARARAEFWSQIGYQVVVADADADASLISLENVTHLRMANRFAERIRKATVIAKTPYIALHPDDDYFTVTGIEAAVENLRLYSHKGFSYGYTWELAGDGLQQARVLPMYLDSWSLRYPELLRSQLNPLSIGRSYASVNYEAVMLFGVYRTDLLARNLDLIMVWEPDCYGGFEIINSLLIVLSSQAINCGETLWIRDAGEPSVRSQGDSWDRELEFDNWYHSEFFDWLERFLVDYSMSGYFTNKMTDNNLLEYRKLTERFFKIFLSKSKEQNPSKAVTRLRHLFRVLRSKRIDGDPFYFK